MTAQRVFADGAIIGANVRTLDDELPIATALSWKEGVVTAVGDDREVRESCDSRTRVIDGTGLTVVPGLVDAHIHPFFVEQTRGADLTSCATLADVAEALAREREARHDGVWVLGWGLEYNVFGTEEISAKRLTEVLGEVPAYVSFMDQHTAIATPPALALAGVSRPPEFEASAAVVYRAGRPTGELREPPAMELVRRAIPPLAAVEIRRRAAASIRRLNEVGLTGAHVMDGSPATFELMRELEAGGDLTLRLTLPLWQKPDMELDEMRAQSEFVGERGRLWRGGVAKFFIDGVIDSGTAWLYEPDEDGAGTLPFWPDPDKYATAVAIFARAGFQCVTHAVGDYAVHAALDAYLQAEQVFAPHRVEHIETLDPRDLSRFARQGVAASMQPLHMQWRSLDGRDSWTRRLGPRRAERGFPTRSLLESGALLALGSDWPVAQSDPRIGMAWAILRRPIGVEGQEAFEPEQRLGADEVLRAYTVACARVAGESSVAGRLRAGMRADVTVFGADPLVLPPDDLPELPVALTIVDGRVVFRSAA